MERLEQQRTRELASDYQIISKSSHFVLDSVSSSQIEEMAAAGCTMKEMAAYFHLDQATWRKVREEMPLIDQIIDFAESHENFVLRRKQIDLAKEGNVEMLKWVGKHRLGQRDEVKVNVNLESAKFFMQLPDDTPEPEYLEATVISQDDGS